MNNPLGSALYNQFSLVPDEKDRLDLGLPARQPVEMPSVNFSGADQMAPKSSGPGIASALSAGGTALGAAGGPVGSVAGGTLGGAATGATVGSLGGPIGTGIGAGIGAGVGLLSGLFGAGAASDEEKRRLNLEAAQQEYQGTQNALRTGTAGRGNALLGLDSGLRQALLGGR